MSDLVSFTEAENSRGNLSKTYSLDADGKLVKTPAAQMSRGTATRKTMPFSSLDAYFASLESNKAVIWGVHAQLDETILIQTKLKAHPPHSFPRSKDTFIYPDSPGVLMIDHDPSVYGTTLTAAELIAKLAEIHPALAQAAYIVRGSVSSGVHRVGDAPAEGKGFHVYFPVLDASDIPRYGALLFDRLWLAGWGFCVLSACGSVLLRGPIDAAVFSPERLDFVASPIIVGEGLTYTKPDATFKEGGYLDTRSLPDLSTEEVTEVARLQAAAKLAIKPEGERKAKVWGDARVSEMVGRGSSREQAEATVKRVLAGGVSALTAEFVLRFANGDVATVSEVLANPEKFDKKALADPVEGVSYGATTAKFYWNEGKPFINSNAHGGCKYALADVELDDANSVIDRLSRLSLLEYEMQRVDAAKCLGIRVGSLDDLVDHARYANAPAAPGDNEPFTVPPPWPEPVNGGMWSTGGCSTIGLCRCR